MLLLDLTHTSHTRARTGIQRVARSIRREWSGRARPICFDPYLGDWRGLEDWEEANLASESPSDSRGARWPLAARLRGRIRRAFRVPIGAPALGKGVPQADGVVLPEIFSPAVAAALPRLFGRSSGPNVALFHDAIALRLPEMTPAKSVARFPAYLAELLMFDGVAAVSDDSRQALLEHWEKTGAKDHPPVASIPLGVDVPNNVADLVRDRNVGQVGDLAHSHRPQFDDRGETYATVLSVATIEGRKNHLALLEACEDLWSRGRKFELRLVGLARPETGQAALDRIAALEKSGRFVRYEGSANDKDLDDAYRSAAFTVYPSLMEGFGLPVLESLARGTPCVCLGRGALGESARGGGCLALESMDSKSLAEAIDRLLSDPALLSRLRSEALARKFKSWADYARELEDWMGTLKK